jgi:acyl carrier protein phosphodiesterase
MNYLAHIYLAGASREEKLGALLGDFVKDLTHPLYSPVLRFEIMRHRRIDRFTDSHPIVLEAKKLFSSTQRRYAGILLDMFYDHLLAKHWVRYSSVELEGYSLDFYQAFDEYAPILPERLQLMLPKMLAENWLLSYRDFAGIQQAIRRLSARLKNSSVMQYGCDELLQHYALLEVGFFSFFEELQQFSQMMDADSPKYL